MSYTPTIKQLKYLVTLQGTLHFSRAAELCHVTQSTLSAGIQELESLLGVQLVERSKRQVLFTPTGNAVADRAADILNDMDDLTLLAKAASNPMTGETRLGIIPTIAPYLLPTIMPVIRTAFPDMTFAMQEAKSADLCRMIKAGELDLVLYALPYDCPDVEEMPIFEDPFMAVYAADCREPAGPVTLNSLKENNILLLDEGHCLRDHALAACHLTETTSSSFSGTSLATITHMVASGYGMTLLPEMAVKSGLADQAGLQVRPFKDPVPSRTIGLIWRKSNPRADVFRKLGTVIREHCDPSAC